MRYYHKHLLISLAAGLIFWKLPDAGLLAGVAIYASREARDWEKLGYFDAKGFWWPVIGSILLYIILHFLI